MFRSEKQVVTVLLWTEKKQDGQSLSKEFTFEEENDTDDHSSEKIEKESNTEEKEKAPQDDIVCLK